MEFIIRFIRNVRNKLNRNVTLSALGFTLMCGAVAGLVMMAIALVVPIYWASLIAVLLFGLGIPVGLVLGYRKRVGDKTAALYIDKFGFDEKIITALENKDKEGGIYELQREDAFECLRAEGNKVKVKVKMPWKHLGIALGCVGLGVVLFFVDTPAKSQALERHTTKMEAKEEKEKAEEMLDALADVAEQGELSPEELEKLQEIMKSLENSKNEFSDAKDKSELEKAKDKYEYKLDQAEKTLGEMSANKTPNALSTIKNAEEIAKHQSETNNQVADNSNQMSQNNGNNNDGQNNDNGQDGNQGSQDGQQNGNENGNQSGNQNNGDNGNSESGNSGQQGDGGNQNGGDQGGNGAGDDQGNGSGQDQGGNGGTGGSGAGHGESDGNATQEPRDDDYVSVDEHASSQYNANDNSQYYKDKNGLVWEGNKVPYNTVIKKYSNHATEGIDKGKYPGGMSGVIKNYFSELE